MTPIEKVLHVLNTSCEADIAATHAVIANIIPCNEALADHPVVTVQTLSDGNFVTSLGLINGIVYALTGKMIASKWDIGTDGNPKFIGFQEYTNEVPPMPEEYK